MVMNEEILVHVYAWIFHKHNIYDIYRLPSLRVTEPPKQSADFKFIPKQILKKQEATSANNVQYNATNITNAETSEAKSTQWEWT